MSPRCDRLTWDKQTNSQRKAAGHTPWRLFCFRLSADFCPLIGDHVLLISSLPLRRSQELRKKCAEQFDVHSPDRPPIFFLQSAPRNPHSTIALAFLPSSFILRFNGADTA